VARPAVAVGGPVRSLVGRPGVVTDMNRTNNESGACVGAWLELVSRGQPPERLVRVLEVGVSTIWGRVRPVLRDATMRAIADRVLRHASQERPILAHLRVRDGGLACEALQARASALPPAELADGVRLVLVDLLSVLDRLTCEILTPALHAELWKVAPALCAPEDAGRGAVPA